MALQLLSLRFLPVLVSLLAAQGQEAPDPKVQGLPQETETCQRPRWSSSLQLSPDQENYKKNEEVMLSCPEGFQPTFTHVKCAREVQSISHGKPVYRDVWLGRNTRDDWIRIRSSVECLVPDKLEKLWLDPSTGFLRWKPLPSCKGEIIGYQLNITTSSTQDGSLLEMERLWLNSPVTEYRLPEHSPGSRYVVMIQGLTAAGAGAASLWELQANSSDTPHPLDISCHSIRDISPSQGTAVLPLHPIAHPSEAVREHQLIVAVMDNVTSVEGACSWELQPFNASQQRGAYVAAVLNLTAPTEFVLGNGTHGQGYHNAALHLGWDYMVLLRLVRRSQQAEKFSCICYSFSLVAGQHPGPWHGTVVGVVVLLVLLLISAGILWFVLSRKRKSLPSKAKEDH